jgi:hypothetical protein
MALESGTKISQLVQDNPPGTDQVAQGDDHIRLIKGVLKASFPSDVAVQIPDTTGHKGAVLTVSEDETQTEWVSAEGPTGKSVLNMEWHDLGDWAARPGTGWTTTHSFEVTPVSETSQIQIAITGWAGVSGYGPAHRCYVRLFDSTNGVDLTGEYTAVGFQDLNDTGGISLYSGFSLRTNMSTHSASAFVVAVQSHQNDLPNEAGVSLAMVQASVTEIE